MSLPPMPSELPSQKSLYLCPYLIFHRYYLPPKVYSYILTFYSITITSLQKFIPMSLHPTPSLLPSPKSLYSYVLTSYSIAITVSKIFIAMSIPIIPSLLHFRKNLYLCPYILFHHYYLPKMFIPMSLSPIPSELPSPKRLYLCRYCLFQRYYLPSKVYSYALTS